MLMDGGGGEKMTGASITNIEQLLGGLTNLSYHVMVDGEPLVLRIPNADGEKLLNRQAEAEAYQAIAGLGIADEVLYMNPDSGIKLSRYYTDSTPVRLGQWEDVEACMLLLRKLHNSGITVPQRFDVEAYVTRYAALCFEAGCLDERRYQHFRTLLRRPFELIRRCGLPLVLCHMDCRFDNYLYLPDGSYRLIDWEYAGMCHVPGDLAACAVNELMYPSDLDRLISIYTGRHPRNRERQLCYSYAAASALMWGLWVDYRTHFGADYGDFGNKLYALIEPYAYLANRQP